MLANLNDIVRRHMHAHRLGLVLFAPVGVALEPLSAVEPDLVFVARAQRAIVQSKGIFEPARPGGRDPLAVDGGARPRPQ